MKREAMDRAPRAPGVSGHRPPVTGHALAAVAAALLLAVPAWAGEAEWRMLYEQSAAHLQAGNVRQAELFAREALRESELLPERTRATELSLLRAAHVLRLQGKGEEALPLAERAVKMAERLHGAAHPNAGIALQIQAEIQSGRRQYQAAEALHQRALGIFRKAYGEKHMSVAVSLHNVGAMLYAQDRNREAEQHLRRALAVKEQLLKRDNLSIAHTLDQLSIVLAAQGRQIEAEKYKRRAEGIRRRAQSPGKPGA